MYPGLRTDGFLTISSFTLWASASHFKSRLFVCCESVISSPNYRSPVLSVLVVSDILVVEESVAVVSVLVKPLSLTLDVYAV